MQNSRSKDLVSPEKIKQNEFDPGPAVRQNDGEACMSEIADGGVVIGGALWKTCLRVIYVNATAKGLLYARGGPDPRSRPNR